jgi:hypothetical protein
MGTGHAFSGAANLSHTLFESSFPEKPARLFAPGEDVVGVEGDLGSSRRPATSSGQGPASVECPLSNKLDVTLISFFPSFMRRVGISVSDDSDCPFVSLFLTSPRANPVHHSRQRLEWQLRLFGNG